jgi:hypothetical protein
MSLKTKILGIGAIAVASFVSSCTESGPSTPKTQAEKEQQEQTHAAQVKDYLHRLEIYSKFSQAVDQNSYPIKDDGQFTTMVVDSAGLKMNLFLSNASAWAFMMDRLDPKKNMGYTLDDINLIENRCPGDGVPNMHSFEVHLTHESSHGKENAPHLESGQTVLNELKYYNQYGSMFSLGSGICEYKGNMIPAFIEFDTPKGTVRVDQGQGDALEKFYESVDHFKLVKAGQKKIDLSGSEGSATYGGYVLKMEAQ